MQVVWVVGGVAITCKYRHTVRAGRELERIVRIASERIVHEVREPTKQETNGEVVRVNVRREQIGAFGDSKRVRENKETNYRP